MLYIMEQCIYFSEDDIQLQYIGRKLGSTVDRNPKCHPEFSGEGIGYSLGSTKLLYRMTKLKYKRGKEKKLKSVRHCISHDIITTDLVINYSAKARRYIKYYHFLHASKLNNVEGTTQSACLELLLQEIEKMVKTYETHRCMGYSHYGYFAEGLKGSVI